MTYPGVKSEPGVRPESKLLKKTTTPNPVFSNYCAVAHWWAANGPQELGEQQLKTTEKLARVLRLSF